MFNGFSPYSFSFIFLLWLTGVSGQIPGMRQALLDGYDPSGEAIWINEYVGTLDHVHDLSLGLLFDGSEYYGIYYLVSSQTKFTLEGSKIGNEISLEEFDSVDRLVGFIHLSVIGDKLQGFWRDKNRSQKLHLSLRPVSLTTDVSGCLDNVYHHIYTNKAQTNETVIQYKYNDIATIKRYKGDHTEVYEEKIINLYLSPLTGNLLPDEVVLTGAESSPYQKIYSLKFTCECYADFDNIYTAIKPRISSSFDNWLDKICTSRSSKRYFNRNADLTSLGSDERFSKRHDIWVNISFYNESFVSGVINFQSTDNLAVEKRGFIFDLNKEKEIAWDKVLLKGITLDSIVEESLDPNRSFSVLSITPVGIQGETAFSSIYGEEQIEIPSGNLSRYVKKEFLSNFWSKN